MVSFKAVTREDIPSLIKMMEAFYAIDHYPIDRGQSSVLIAEVISNPALGQLWIIKDGDEVAGYAVLTIVMSFEYGGMIGFLDELYVKAPHRNRGIGRLAIEFIQQQADKLSLKVLYLEVEPHNEGAQKLYIAAGFSQHARALMRNRRT